MTERQTRPDVKEIKDAYDYLFNSSLSLTKIRDAALGGRLFRASDLDGSAGVAGRSLVWKLFLIHNGPLQSTPDVPAVPPLEAMRASREEYVKLLLEKMKAPDGGYEEGFTIPGTGESPPRTARSSSNLEKNNPLSLHDENPWTKWFASVDLRKTILQDVERTFPDIGYFRDSEVQAQLTSILFIYSVMHPEIGYRQGMHELLAPLYYAVDYDSIPDTAAIGDASLKEFCSRAWVAADAWVLFVSVMNGVGRWYEWQESKTVVQTSALASHVQLIIPSGDMSMKAYVAPIVEACNLIQSTYLKRVDPELWKAMQNAGIEPQIYGIRWLRLLFTREFDMHDAMIIWDGLFACDPTFDLALWICVAMLIRIRNKLIPSDYSGQLTYLLRYPTSQTSSQFTPETSLHHTTLLLRQALTLQMSPSPTTGVSVIHENKNLLNIPVEVPEPPPPPVRRRPRLSERGQSFSSESLPSTSRGMHMRQQSTPMGLPELIARGLLERGESLGINKTVMNAVSELKRNLPDLTTTLSRLPITPQTSYAAYPLVDERPVTERPPWEPRTRFEMERDVSDMRALQKKLGDSVAWIVDTLLLDEGEGTPDAQAKTIQNRKREALECLSYVRDVLKGTVTEVEEERLISEEESKRRAKTKEQKDKERAQAASREPPTPNFPPPAASLSVEVRPQAIPTSRSQDYLASRPPQGRSPPNLAAVAHPIHTARAPPSSFSPSASFSMVPPVPVSSASATPFAPWNHTRSSFGGGESPIATLPRLPPRTSTTLRPAISSSAFVPPRPSHEISRDQPPRRVQQDPLGALP